MGGRPYQAVKVGAHKIGKACLSDEVEARPFERFITITYDSRLEVYESKDAEAYAKFIDSTSPRGATDFKMVFDWLKKFILENGINISDLVIVFFTDGCDTTNSKGDVAESLADLQNMSTEFKNSFKTRFLSIGFSQNHDAVFMN